MLSSIPAAVTFCADRLAHVTQFLHENKYTRFVTATMVLFAPFTLAPTVHEAWTADNIDALRTLTWPLLTIVQVATLIPVCHKGTWDIQLSTFIGVLLLAAIWLAVLIR